MTNELNNFFQVAEEWSKVGREKTWNIQKVFKLQRSSSSKDLLFLSTNSSLLGYLISLSEKDKADKERKKNLLVKYNFIVFSCPSNKLCFEENFSEICP